MWPLGYLFTSYAVQLSKEPYMLLSCCPIRVSKQASSAASLAPCLNSPGTGHWRGAPKTTKPNFSSLPSYKSRRSFGLSSVFPSVSRHVGPNPDVEIITADAAAEFRESLLPLSRVTAQNSTLNFRSCAWRTCKCKFDTTNKTWFRNDILTRSFDICFVSNISRCSVRIFC